MALKDSQISLYEHSEIKIRLLKLYLEQYLNVLYLSPYVDIVYVYDLFCGEGVYENGGEGSPLIILNSVKTVYCSDHTSKNSIGRIHSHFNDINPDKIVKLKSIINERKLTCPEIGSTTFSSKDYKELVPLIVKKTLTFRKQKAFIFIGPYGYKDIKVSDIQALLISQKTEVLLFLPTQFMFRFEKKGTPESLKDFIEELVPTEQWPQSNTGVDFIENLTDAFRNKLGNKYFVDSFIISRDKNQFFCLFFFTSHIYGFDRMLNSKWKLDEEEGRGWSLGAENSLFSQGGRRPNTGKFEKRLVEFLSKERGNGEIYEFTLHNGHLTTHAKDILMMLQDTNKLTTRCLDGSVARKSSFYLNYTSYRDCPNRILLKIK
jgi:three-Cys-motif partner protein